jgi:lipopolysaccharide/colanic/teichoic acid biosynthesis glycosyltransferase
MPAKRIFDLVASFVLLLLTLPIWLLIGVVILATERGPVFYLGERTGLNGRPFRIIKFRTMTVDAERQGGGTTALNDPRIYPFGRLLRHYKLDELPQLFNVLRGEMSMVGPRPELPRYTAQYTPEEMTILSVRPGITDPSSIRFSSLDEIVGAEDADRIFEETVLPEKNRLRLSYARSHSFAGDIKILFMTGWCILQKIRR